MSVFFAMVPGPDGDDTPAFYLRQSQAPIGAIQISDARHAQLLEAQAEGKRIVVGKDGKPRIETPRKNAAARQAEIVTAIQREAADRIAQVSPLWQQLNDSRDLSPEGARRFTQIDAIRAASNDIQQTLSKIPANQLAEFPTKTHPLWPEAY